MPFWAPDELGNKYAKKGFHRGGGRGKKKAIKESSGPGWTINLCLFQLRVWLKWCKIRAGMSSISVSSSVPLCVDTPGVIDWFCHSGSVHSMLTRKGRVGLWRTCYQSSGCDWTLIHDVSVPCVASLAWAAGRCSLIIMIWNNNNNNRVRNQKKEVIILYDGS